MINLQRMFAGLVLVAAVATSASTAVAGSMKDDRLIGGALPWRWDGLYVGAHVGGINVDAEATAIGFPVSASASSDDVAYGLLAGYNFQAGSWVFGIEGDWSYVDSADAFTLRGRLGWAFDRWLVFGTAGGSWLNFDDADLTGYVVGGGVEVKLTRNIALRGEVLYHDFGSETFTVLPGIGANVDVDALVYRAALTLQFN